MTKLSVLMVTGLMALLVGSAFSDSASAEEKDPVQAAHELYAKMKSELEKGADLKKMASQIRWDVSDTSSKLFAAEAAQLLQTIIRAPQADDEILEIVAMTIKEHNAYAFSTYYRILGWAEKAKADGHPLSFEPTLERKNYMFEGRALALEIASHPKAGEKTFIQLGAYSLDTMEGHFIVDEKDAHIAIEIINTIFDHSATAGEYGLSFALQAIDKMELPQKEVLRVLDGVQKLPGMTERLFGQIAKTLVKYDPSPFARLQKIMQRPQATPSTLESVAEAIVVSSVDIPETSELLRSILNDPRVTKGKTGGAAFTGVVKSFQRPKFVLKDGQEIIDLTMTAYAKWAEGAEDKLEAANSNFYSALLFSIGESASQIDRRAVLFRVITEKALTPNRWWDVMKHTLTYQKEKFISDEDVKSVFMSFTERAQDRQLLMMIKGSLDRASFVGKDAVLSRIAERLQTMPGS